jgi:hypothetical protein
MSSRSDTVMDPVSTRAQLGPLETLTFLEVVLRLQELASSGIRYAFQSTVSLEGLYGRAGA